MEQREQINLIINALSVLGEILSHIRYIQSEVKGDEWADAMSDMRRGYNKANIWVNHQVDMYREEQQKRKDNEEE